MLGTTFGCAVLLTAVVAQPALAGERKAVALVPEARATLLPDVQPSAGRARVVTLQPAPFVLPSRSTPLDRRGSGAFVTRVDLRAADILLRRSRDERVPGDPSIELGQGADRAVRDTLDDHRKPRQPRSALSTALVLRIDGNSDSPPLSVGGGGVAGAMWRLLPRQ
ncbi:MAG: hypothetical protein J7500_10600 [Sphingomonas sp.]|uniref:hypothetical protein n=1 Tax=Sphingomonas sp. TaxID=28214 RepID=UPI001B2EEA63|nr:hypothetical protein [Sphingomonas sp.]MBO9623149.1 hypothetical protein [Sphingomonas sp.]